MAEGDLKVSGIKLVVEGAAEYQQALKESGLALAQNAAEQKKLDEQYGKGSRNADYLAQKQQKLSEQLELQRKRTQALRDALQEYQKRQDAEPDKIARMNLLITRSEALEAKYGRQIRETGEALELSGQAQQEAADAAEKSAAAVEKSGNAFREAAGEVEKHTSRLNAFAQGAKKAGEGMVKAGDKLTRRVTLPIVAGFSYAAKEAIQFEDAFSGVVKTVDADAKTITQLRQDIIGLSGSGMVTQSKEEVAEIAANAGQLGIQTENIIGFSQAMLQMADATNLSADEGSVSLAKFANITGMAQEEFSNLGSAIVALGNNSATQEDAIVALGMRLAAAGKSAGMSVSDIMGISAAFSSVGMEAEAGGTAVSKMLIDMDTSVAKGEKAAVRFGKIAGMTGKQFQAMWKEDAAGAFTAFVGGLQKIDQSGGNVALTLEKLGIKDQRMRDAMMRAVSAGDLLTQSIALGNRAYRENTALAEEAAKKNSTFAARMKVLRNRFDNASQSLGEGMMPALESAMDTINGLVSGFAGLSEEQRKSMINWGLTAAAAGPVIKILGGTVKGVGSLIHGFQALGPLMAGPAAPFVLGAVGIGALGIAIASLESPMERIQKRMDALSFDIDPDRVRGIEKGIEQGIAAADREYEIKAAVRVEMDSVGESVDSALSDGKLSGKEKKSLTAQLNQLVKASVDDAQKDLQDSVNSYLATLNALKSADGEDLFSEDEKAALIEGISQKTGDLTEKLEGYQKEYDALLNTIYRQREPVTAAQMAEMDALLEKIGSVRAEIALARDEAMQVLETQYNLTISGRGNEETTGAALGYVAEKEARALQEATESRDKLWQAIAQSGADENTRLDQQARAMEAYEDAVSSAAQTAQSDYSKIFEGAGKGAQELTEKLNEAAAAYDALKKIEAAYSIEHGYDQEKLMLALPRELLDQYGYENFSIDDLFDSQESMDSLAWKMTEKLGEGIASAAEKLTVENPLTSLLKGMMEKGVEIDPKQSEGLLESLLKVLDFAGKGEEFGLDLTDAFVLELSSPDTSGKVEGASEELKNAAEKGMEGLDAAGGEAAAQAAQGFYEEALRNGYRFAAAGIANAKSYMQGLNSRKGLFIASPSKNTKKSAYFATVGYTDEIERLLPFTRKMGEKFGTEFTDAMNAVTLERPMLPEGISIDVGLAGNPDRLYEAMHGRRMRRSEGGTVNNINQSAPVTVQNLNVRKESDIYSIAAELDGIGRRRRQGYGS